VCVCVCLLVHVCVRVVHVRASPKLQRKH